MRKSAATTPALPAQAHIARHKKPNTGMRSTFEQTIYPRLAEIAQWARDGAYDKDIAAKLGISEASFRHYKVAFPVLREILESAGSIANQRVENALFARAIGMPSVEIEERPKVTQDADGNEIAGDPVVVKRVTKRLAPDVTACIFWLKNRDPKRWADVFENKVETIDEAKRAEAKAKLRKLVVREMRKSASAPKSPPVIEMVPGEVVEGDGA